MRAVAGRSGESSRSSILWRHLGRPGHDAARLVFAASSWQLQGTAVFGHNGRPCRLDYRIVCDTEWRTISVTVSGWIGPEAVEIVLLADEARRWRRDGAACPDIAGCLDVDLGFTA